MSGNTYLDLLFDTERPGKVPLFFILNLKIYNTLKDYFFSRRNLGDWEGTQATRPSEPIWRMERLG
jgi:hypothetical protein